MATPSTLPEQVGPKGDKPQTLLSEEEKREPLDTPPLINEDFKARLDKIRREFYETKETSGRKKHSSKGTTSILKNGTSSSYKTGGHHQKRDSSPKRVKLVTNIRE